VVAGRDRVRLGEMRVAGKWGLFGFADLVEVARLGCLAFQKGYPMSVTIAPARTDDDITEVTRLAWDFVGFLKERYPERIEFIDAYFRDQKFEEMLADFHNYFTPPKGECVLARLDGVGVGIVKLKPVDGKLCEMNRMFVAPEARGHGVGRKLCTALISRAVELGYDTMRLDALTGHIEALPLYKSLGFEPDADAPDYLKSDPGVVSLRMRLV
jgi:GNAT superfamily N-acetyltransferase